MVLPCRAAMEIGAAAFGPDSGQYDNVLLHFGQAAALNGDYEDAAKTFRRFLDIESRVSTTSNISTAVAKGELAHIYTELHKFPEAQRWFALGPRNPQRHGRPSAPGTFHTSCPTGATSRWHSGTGKGHNRNTGRLDHFGSR
jgi:tetratricopeptide (TPR) repeat protein